MEAAQAGKVEEMERGWSISSKSLLGKTDQFLVVIAQMNNDRR